MGVTAGFVLEKALLSADKGDGCRRSDGQVGQHGMRAIIGGQQHAKAPEKEALAIIDLQGDQASLYAFVSYRPHIVGRR